MSGNSCVIERNESSAVPTSAEKPYPELPADESFLSMPKVNSAAFVFLACLCRAAVVVIVVSKVWVTRVFYIH